MYQTPAPTRASAARRPAPATKPRPTADGAAPRPAALRRARRALLRAVGGTASYMRRRGPVRRLTEPARCGISCGRTLAAVPGSGGRPPVHRARREADGTLARPAARAPTLVAGSSAPAGAVACRPAAAPRPARRRSSAPAGAGLREQRHRVVRADLRGRARWRGRPARPARRPGRARRGGRGHVLVQVLVEHLRGGVARRAAWRRSASRRARRRTRTRRRGCRRCRARSARGRGRRRCRGRCRCVLVTVSTARTSPKSATLTRPSSPIRTFSGFMSRCTKPGAVRGAERGQHRLQDVERGARLERARARAARRAGCSRRRTPSPDRRTCRRCPGRRPAPHWGARAGPRTWPRG